ncbi:MAG TPA: DUF6089 family protein [Luteibaculaceae bacterium]|nr:DUF6089 family protein [Luteibaculaceae bacterium]
MIVRYIGLIGVFTLLGGQMARCQQRELGITGGVMSYLGELNQRPYTDLRPAIGVSYRTTYQNRISWEHHLIAGRIGGADSLQSDPLQFNRNLHFRSNLIELGTQLEINYFEYQMGSKRRFFSPYLFFGFSAFYSNPEANANGQWFKLRAIGTEGQNLPGGKKYNLINFAVPVGAGFKISLGSRVSFAIFTGFRKTFFDHLDDVAGTYADPELFRPEEAVFVDRSRIKQGVNGTNVGLERGNRNTKDWYNYTGFSLCFKTNRRQTACDRVR